MEIWIRNRHSDDLGTKGKGRGQPKSTNGGVQPIGEKGGGLVILEQGTVS